uniref:Methyltransferase n=1 Tax=viral metagenome TaxID=1070528 RepID=A0A6C0LL97_9ZZZZ
MLFDLQYISKSSYTFDLIILFDVNDLITSELLTDIKTNILDPKGEIWVLCDDKKIGNIKKETYLLTILENTNLRSSKFLQNGACIYILK